MISRVPRFAAATLDEGVWELVYAVAVADESSFNRRFPENPLRRAVRLERIKAGLQPASEPSPPLATTNAMTEALKAVYTPQIKAMFAKEPSLLGTMKRATK